jgi:hypothetical protein
MYSKNVHIPMMRKDSVMRMGSNKGLVSLTRPIMHPVHEVKTMIGHLEKR